jgi:two-component system LytT family sensor kinase
MESIKKINLSQTGSQRPLNFVQNRLTPYFLILLFSAAMTCVRVYMIDLPWYLHFSSFLSQAIMLTGLWLLIKWLNAVLEKWIPFHKGPLQRIFIQVMLTLAIVSPLLICSLMFSRPYLPAFVNREFLIIIAVLFCVMVLLFNFSFYAAHFFNNWQHSIEEKARLEILAADLERDKFNLQYHQLRNQVNPHYLFNTLTSLDGLIQTNPELASEFVRHMAKVYRYVLQHKENEVVSLDEELDFIEHYISLLKIRYENALQIEIALSPEAKEKGIVMVTLQMLIDNAIKHNSTQEDEPLIIKISDKNDCLTVSNNLQLRRQMETSNGQGLEQLRKLYSFISDRPILTDQTATSFTIHIPLL